MGRVVMQASMSLDGYIADPDDKVGPLFDWYGNGDVEFTGADPDRVFHVSAASAEYLRFAWPTSVRASAVVASSTSPTVGAAARLSPTPVSSSPTSHPPTGLPSTPTRRSPS